MTFKSCGRRADCFGRAPIPILIDAKLASGASNAINRDDSCDPAKPGARIVRHTFERPCRQRFDDCVLRDVFGKIDFARTELRDEAGNQPASLSPHDVVEQLMGII